MFKFLIKLFLDKETRDLKGHLLKIKKEEGLVLQQTKREDTYQWSWVKEGSNDDQQTVANK